MKRPNKFLALVLALVFCLACFAACGEGDGSDAANSETTVNSETTANSEITASVAGDETTKDSENENVPHDHKYQNGACSVCGEKEPSEGLVYELNADHKSYSVVSMGSCRDINVVVPSEILGKPITKIGDSAFKDKDALKTLVLPEGVISIGDEAFWGCKSLEKISIPSTIESIGESAFNACKSLRYAIYENGKYLGNSKKACVVLCDIVDTKKRMFEIHADTKIIGSNAILSYTVLESLTIPEGVVSIGSEAFSGCTALKSISIPNSIKNIKTDAFKGCTSLKYNEYKNGKYLGNTAKPNLALLGVINKKISLFEIHADTKVIGYSALIDYTALKTLTIGKGVTEIGNEVFCGCTSLASVTIPSSVTEIGNVAFCGCTSLASVTIPSSVTYIGEFAFADCTSLTTVNYTGSEAKWNAINFEFGNDELKAAKMNYNYKG